MNFFIDQKRVTFLLWLENILDYFQYKRFPFPFFIF